MQVKVARSQKQKGGIRSDCGVYAIAFAVAAALGITFLNARITYQRVWPSFPHFSKFCSTIKK